MNDNEAFRAPGHCLQPDEIEAFVEGRADQLAAHVEACPACSHVAASYREFLEADVREEEKADVAWIESRLKKPAPKRSWFGWIGASPLPRWAFSAAAILLIVAGSLQLRRMAGPGLRPSEPGSTVVRSAQVRLVSPMGDVEAAPDSFQWDPVDKAASYEFQITEVDGTPLWTGRTNQAKLNSVPDIQRFMLPRKALLWRVKALTASGGVIAESASERFRVLPSAGR
ncbi:MAG: hypothetical protein QM757_09215 [Paludibaculum sp.]